MRVSKVLVFMLLFSGLLACQSFTELEPAAIPEVDLEQSDWAAVYFSQANGDQLESYRGGPDEELVEAIASARASVDAAIHNLNLWSVRNALIAAHQRGVAVRIVAESDNLADSPELGELAVAGIPIVGDSGQGTMHNKFVIIDRYEVWAGSMNYTLGGAYFNRENLIRLRSTGLAENYLAEFEEMFTSTLFGPESPAGEGPQALEIDGRRVEVYFAPEDGVLERLVELVDTAESSVDLLAFSFTADELAAAILAADERGVAVRAVFDSGQYASNQGGEFDFLAENGLDVRLDGERGDMHHKVLLIDGRILVTGSYNFSRNAEERNDENLLVIWDADLAAEYLLEFEEIWRRARAP